MQTSRNRQRGKEFEKEIAKRLNGYRVGILGKTDVLTDDGVFAIECKSRKSFVAVDWMLQSVKNTPNGKLPLLIVHVTGKRHTEDLVIMRLNDFQDWYGK